MDNPRTNGRYIVDEIGRLPGTVPGAHPMTDETQALLERLRKRSVDGSVLNNLLPGQLYNANGPEAADRIEALTRERDAMAEALRGALPAREQLRNHQIQADMDGCMVTVSRQALDETLDAIDAALANNEQGEG